MKAALSAMLCALAVVPAAPALAMTESFATTNQGALARATALPVLGRGVLLAEGSSAWVVAYDLTSEYQFAQQGGESLLQDGETSHLALRYRRTLAGFEWGVELPLLSVGGGFLDGFIEDWHGWFGLPNGGREQAPHGQYQYHYQRGSTVVFDRRDTGVALGDVQLAVGRKAAEGVALRAMLKLPTGDEARLAGGNAGVAAWADWAFAARPGAAVQGFASAGVSVNARGEPLAEQQRRVVPFGGVGVFWRALQAVDLGAQLYAHGSMYQDSELPALKRAGLQLVFGGACELSPRLRFELAIQEDLVTLSSPDFSVHLGLSLRQAAQ